jgi:capsular polysaccharide transport system permease protein
MIIKIILRILILISLSFTIYYIYSIESEKYESKSIVLLKDISKKQNINVGELLLSGTASNALQDSKILEIYIRSYDMYKQIDGEFNLTGHYTSEELDFLSRLSHNTSLPFKKANKNNLLKMYNENLQVVFDAPSGTLGLTFLHTKPETAQEIMRYIIDRSEYIVNGFEKESTKIALEFIKRQIEEKRREFIDSIRRLIEYQNRHHSIDPSIDVKRKTTILSELEAKLIQTQVDYDSKVRIYNTNSREIKILKESIRNIKNSIKRIKEQLSGQKDGQELNVNVFEFELLKSNMEFAKEVYRRTLINQEETKIELAQKSKHLLVIEQPTLADDYTYPNKAFKIITYIIIYMLLYSIIIAIISIIQNHRD